MKVVVSLEKEKVKLDEVELTVSNNEFVEDDLVMAKYLNLNKKKINNN